jgi:hypothetical protein
VHHHRRGLPVRDHPDRRRQPGRALLGQVEVAIGEIPGGIAAGIGRPVPLQVARVDVVVRETVPLRHPAELRDLVRPAQIQHRAHAQREKHLPVALGQAGEVVGTEQPAPPHLPPVRGLVTAQVPEVEYL